MPSSDALFSNRFIRDAPPSAVMLMAHFLLTARSLSVRCPQSSHSESSVYSNPRSSSCLQFSPCRLRVPLRLGAWTGAGVGTSEVGDARERSSAETRERSTSS